MVINNYDCITEYVKFAQRAFSGGNFAKYWGGGGGQVPKAQSL